MGLIKGKPILIHDDFLHYDDAFNTENQKLKNITAKVLPSLEYDVSLDKQQQVFYSCNLMLNKLIDNDRYIENYFSKSIDQSLSVSLLSDAFKQEVYTLTSDKFETTYAEHIAEYHSNFSDKMQLSTIYQNYLHTDCSNFKEDECKSIFLKSVENKILADNDEVTLSNDFVVETEFDDSPNVVRATNYILVSICNKLTNYEFRQMMTTNQIMSMTESSPNTRDSKYIYKRWLSGLKEFYIYIPSTFTMYVEDPDSTELDKRTTFILIKINKRHFKINHIYSCNICGQSLPMLIHANSNKYFNDVILPSILRTLCLSDSKANNTDCIYDANTNLYTLYFACSGTDAQAIHIIAD